MPQARKYQVAPEVTPYYHCISRCVRRAFLCGYDRFSARSFEHRRQWIVERMNTLAQVFAIDIAAYAVMSNHFHLVLKIQQQQASEWTLNEVIERWTSIFSPPVLIRRYQAGEALIEGEAQALQILVETWRERLCSLSWFMRALNEPIARMANQEDACTGRFWEGRFLSQAILDEAALLTIMAYVDLNPIRAGLAETPEASEFTSIQARIRAWGKEQKLKQGSPLLASETPSNTSLLHFSKAPSESEGIPFAFHDYLALVDWTGRMLRSGKRGAIPNHYPPILNRLSIDRTQFLHHMKRPQYGFHRVIGALKNIRHAAERFGMRFFKGQANAAKLFRAA